MAELLSISLFILNTLYFLYVVLRYKRNILRVVFNQLAYVFFIYYLAAIVLLWIDSFLVEKALLVVCIIDGLTLLICSIKKTNRSLDEKRINKEDIVLILVFAFLMMFTYKKSEDIRFSGDMGMYFERYSAFLNGHNGKYVGLKELGEINDYVDEQLIEYSGLGIIEKGNRTETLFSYQGLPTWTTIMVPFGKILGWENGLIVLTINYYLSVLAIFFFCKRIVNNKYGKWCALIVYAFSPIILYISKCTFTEGALDAVLLLGLYYLTFEDKNHYLYGSMWLGISGFLHISMYLYIFPILLALMYMQCVTKRRKYLTAQLVLGAMHVLSLFYSICVSHLYSKEQLQRFGFISRNIYIIIFLFFIGEFAIVVFSYSNDHFDYCLTDRLLNLFEKKWKTIVIASITIVLLGAKYYTYVICMTNKLPVGDNKSSWHIRESYVGTGIEAIWHLNLINILESTSVFSLILLCIYAIKKGTMLSWQKALWGVLFFSVFLYTYVQVDTPMNYYGSRYFTPIIIPVICILVSSMIDKRVFVPFMIWSVVYNLFFDISFIRDSSQMGQYKVLKMSQEVIPKNSIVIMGREANELITILQDNMRRTNNCKVYLSGYIDVILEKYKGQKLYIITDTPLENTYDYYLIERKQGNQFELIYQDAYDITYSMGGDNGMYLVGAMDTYHIEEYIYAIEN